MRALVGVLSPRDTPGSKLPTLDCWFVNWIRVIDPSAGSPTETLLRLLLPLSNKVHSTFHSTASDLADYGPKYSPDCSIGRSDGRCVQRAGT